MPRSSPPEPRRSRVFGPLVMLLFTTLLLASRSSLALVGTTAGLFALTAWGCLLCAAVPMGCHAYGTFCRQLPPQRVLWIVPLVSLVWHTALVLVGVGWPGWANHPDLWRNATGLGLTAWFRLVTTLLVMVGFHVLMLFVNLVDLFLRTTLDGRRSLGEEGESSEQLATSAGPASRTDGLTSVAALGGLAFLALLLLAAPVVLPQNVGFVKAWVVLGLERRPVEAMDAFDELAAKFPGTEVAESALFRSARVASDVLGRPLEAAKRLDLLLATYPDSPLADDAHYAQALLCLGPLSDPGRAERHLGALLARFGHSYLAGRAAVALAVAWGRLGRGSPARQLLDSLERTAGHQAVIFEDADEKLVVKPLSQLIAQARSGLGP